MAGGPGGDEDGKLPPVDHDPLNEGAVGKIVKRYISELNTLFYANMKCWCTPSLRRRLTGGTSRMITFITKIPVMRLFRTENHDNKGI